MTSDKKSEKFFKVLHDRMKKAQQETKSTVSVNMSDIGNKPREDKDEPDPGTKGMGPCPPRKANACLVGQPDANGVGLPIGRGETFMMPGTPSRYPLALGFRKGHDTGEQGQNNDTFRTASKVKCEPGQENEKRKSLRVRDISKMHGTHSSAITTESLHCSSLLYHPRVAFSVMPLWFEPRYLHCCSIRTTKRKEPKSKAVESSLKSS